MINHMKHHHFLKDLSSYERVVENLDFWPEKFDNLEMLGHENYGKIETVAQGTDSEQNSISENLQNATEKILAILYCSAFKRVSFMSSEAQAVTDTSLKLAKFLR